MSFHQKKQKILFFIDWYVPGYKAGGPIQSCKNLVALLCEDYEVFIMTSDRDLGDSRSYEGIQTNSWINQKEGVSIYYATPGVINQNFLKQQLFDIKPDFVYLNSMFSFSFSILPLFVLRRMGLKVKTILAPRGMLHQGALKFKKIKKLLFLNVCKISGLFKAVHFHATDEQETYDIKKFFPGNEITLINNIPNQEFPEIKRAENKKNGYVKMVFLSRIAAKKNILDFIKWLKKANINNSWQLDIYGNTEDEEYYKLCASEAEGLPVSFFGPVRNEEVKALFAQYDCFVLPTKGENFGHAIFEALSIGLPVMISDQTPWLNLEPQKAGFDISLHHPEKFIDSVQAFADMTHDQWLEWSKGARNKAKQYLSETNYKEKYFSLFA